jgi:hypothetical protein
MAYKPMTCFDDGGAHWLYAHLLAQNGCVADVNARATPYQRHTNDIPTPYILLTEALPKP